MRGRTGPALIVDQLAGGPIVTHPTIVQGAYDSYDGPIAGTVSSCDAAFAPNTPNTHIS